MFAACASQLEKREKTMSVRTRVIPSSDFFEWKSKLETLGFEVLDQGPVDTVDGFCTLHFVDPADVPSAAAAKQKVPSDT
jgi:hypothetical protein